MSILSLPEALAFLLILVVVFGATPAYSTRLDNLTKVNASLAAQAKQQPRDFACLQTGNQELWLQKTNSGIRLAALLDLYNNRNLLAQSDQPVFRLVLRVNGAEQVISGAEGWKSCGITSNSSGVKIVLKGRAETGLKKLQATITAKPSADQRSINWRLSVDTEKSASVIRARFPEVTLNIEKGYWNLLFPVVSGIVDSGEKLKSIERVGYYPDGWCAMQLMSVYDSRSGLYFACHDPYGSHRVIFAKGYESSMLLYTEQYAPNMTVPGNGYRTEYDTNWQVFRGDWFDACSIYKKWVQKEAKWYSRKGQPRKPATPEDINTLSCWTISGGSAEECVDSVIKFKKYMGVPTGLHWYNWHEIPFDNDYPHYFPTKPGMKEGVKKLQSAGVYVMPYINGRLWDSRDRSTEDWEFSSKALPGTTKDESGKPYLESYGSKESDGSDVKLSIMCPASEIWRQTMQDIVLRLTDEVGVDGVYMDQIAAAVPRLCMDSSHGHPLGGGNWWTQSYWKLLGNIRDKLAKGKFLTTECNAEPYTRFFDSYLTWHWQENNMVAAFSAVYGGSVGMFGRAYAGDAGAVRAKVGQQLAFGEQIGWCSPEIINDPAKGEYMRQAVKLRYAFREVFANGDMLRPLLLSCDQQPVTTDWQWNGPKMVTTAPVLSGSWKKGDAVVIVFANVTDKPVKCSFNINAKEYGLAEKELFAVYDGSGEKTGEIRADLSQRQNLEIGAAQIVAWQSGKVK